MNLSAVTARSEEPEKIRFRLRTPSTTIFLDGLEMPSDAVLPTAAPEEEVLLPSLTRAATSSTSAALRLRTEISELSRSRFDPLMALTEEEVAMLQAESMHGSALSLMERSGETSGSVSRRITLSKMSDQVTQLDQLVARVQKLVLLEGLTKTMWNNDHIYLVKTFMMRPDLNVLVMYFNSQQEFCVEYVPPKEKVNSMYFFIKNPGTEIISTENFTKVIHCGNMRGNLIISLLKHMQTIFMPMILKNKTWPESLKSDFSSQLYKFMATLTDTRYKMRGETALFVPDECSSKVPQQCARNKELVQRLEGVVVLWIRQMKELVNAEDMDLSENIGPIEEIEYWNCRSRDLSGLCVQLDNPRVHLLIDILYHAKSTQLVAYNKLVQQIQECANEALSNYKFLLLLQTPCKILTSSLPDEIPLQIANIVSLVRVVWMQSAYYNTREKITGLFRKISAEIIQQCCKAISFDSIIQGRAIESITILEQSIVCCQEWKRLYKELAAVHHKYSAKGWYLDATGIFAQVDAFVQRCSDLLQVCQCQIHFGRREHGEQKPVPAAFRGRKATSVYQALAEADDLFTNALENLSEVRPHVLNVRSAIWHETYSRFHQSMKDLDVLIQNAINTAFETVHSVESAVMVLDAFFHFRYREPIRRILDKKTAHIYNMITDEINAVRKDFSAKRWVSHSALPNNSGHALYARSLIQHIARPMQAMEQAWWLPKIGVGDETISQHEQLVIGLNDYILKVFKDWLNSLDPDPTKSLEVPLMVRSFEMPGMLETNFGRSVTKLFQEVLFWKRQKFQPSQKITDMFEAREPIRSINEGVLRVVREYNRIMAALSQDEQLLFKERIAFLDRKIGPGLTRLTWSYPPAAELYLNDCRPVSSKIQNLVNFYKQANADIGMCCQTVCEMQLVFIDSRRLYEESDFEDEQVGHRRLSREQIDKLHDQIVKIVGKVWDIFQNDGLEVKKQWWKYTDRIDFLVEEALRILMRRSLKHLLRAVAGEGKTLPSRLMKVKVVLVEKKIDFRPSLKTLAVMLSSIFGQLSETLKGIHRVADIHSYQGSKREAVEKVLSQDEECQMVQNSINNAMTTTATKLQNYLHTWEPFKDIWEVNKDLFILRYQTIQPTVASFDADIARYTEVANNVQMQETLVNLQFVVVDCNPLKQSILNHCMEWQNKFTTLLKDMTLNKLNSIYDYMSVNGKKLRQVPDSLEQLRASVQLQQKILKEKDEMNASFTPLREQFVILAKYEVPVSETELAMLNDLETQWQLFLQCLTVADEMLKKNQDRFKSGLMNSADDMKRSVSHFVEEFAKHGPFTNAFTSVVALETIQEMQVQVEDLRKKEEDVRKGLAFFKIDQPPSRELHGVEKELKELNAVWLITVEWEQLWASQKDFPFYIIDVFPLEDLAAELMQRAKQVCAVVKEKNWQISDFTLAQVQMFQNLLPIVRDLKNSALRERHWEQVKAIAGQPFDETANDFNMEKMVSLGLDQYVESVYDISVSATKELALEEQLKGIKRAWEDVKMDMAPYKDKVGQYILRSSDDVFATLEEHQMALAAMKASRYVKPFESEVDYWERTLSTVMETVEAVSSVQRLWMYLENIFVGEDIRKQLPSETFRFDQINIKWKEIAGRLFHDSNAMRASQIPGFNEQLLQMASGMEDIQKSLEMYLETKRRVFPRFYFISSDDLLEILGQSKNPDAIQPHLKKCFDNLVKLKTTKHGGRTEAFGMYSVEGEYVEFTQSMVLDGPVEYWLTDVEYVMRTSLRELMGQCRTALRKNLNKRDKWLKDWPGQLCITCNQIQWTSDTTRALGHSKEVGDKQPLKFLKKKQVVLLNKFSEAIRTNLPKLQRIKIVGTVTIEVHARDVIEKLIKQNCMDPNGFEWLSQMRFYWENNDCMTRLTNTQFQYRHEYLGNSGRLVVTPLTDRCYITLTTALHLHRGGSPKGPAGTGKTETVKDLGKALAVYVIVINCSEGLDYISMGKMFAGLAQTGAWICYDEFNRINVEVLSVVAQQVICVLSALANNQKRFLFFGDDIPIIWSCGMFITMNPGYAGRTELPENLKSMFRPISMVCPDNTMISEILLFGEGFDNTRILAKKVTTLYSLSIQQLSKQDQYDFGLRGLVAVLRHAGRKRRENQHLPHEEVVLLAMKDMNVPKLTAIDVPLFNGIINDLFPGIEVSQIDYSRLLRTMEQDIIAGNLQFVTHTTLKVIQLFETKNSRHSTVICGQTGTGKTVSWRLLQKLFIRLNREGEPGYVKVYDYPINPKAITMGELYGELNLSTGEWMDGVLSSIARNVCNDERPDQKWIVFDSPVDALWIESMNSLMDDNKVLTIISGERISMPEQVSLLFETQDLSVASPATVSRCGIVYYDYSTFGWNPYVDSWLAKCKKPYADELRKHFDQYLQKLLDHKKATCKELVPTDELGAVASLCRVLESVVSEKNGVVPEDEAFQLLVRLLFIFACVWTVGASVDEDGRTKIDSFIRELEPTIGGRDTVYEYYVDTKLKTWIHWEDRLPRDWKYNPNIPFFKIIVPSVDTVRYNYLVSMLLKRHVPVLLCGAVGTGKTSVAMGVINDLDSRIFKYLNITLSAQTSSKMVQDIIESKVEKRTKGVYVPIGGKLMITYLDDFNMPVRDTYGSQPPLELIRMWIEYGFWYSRTKQVPVFVKDMILMASMGPPGGGRSPISKRLQNKFVVINMTFPSDAQIKRIYGTMISQKLVEFDEEVKGLAERISEATLDVYNSVFTRMLPTPAKIHYLFNMRDISKVFQGLLRAHRDYHDTLGAMLRLWVHECSRVFADRLTDDRDRETFTLIIAERLALVFNQTYHNLCRQVPIFVDYMNPNLVYEDVKDFKAIKKHIEQQLNEFNNAAGQVRMELVPFRDAVEHLSRLIRVIRLPLGNVLQIGIGGSGRQSISRLAAFICGYKVFQIEIKRIYRKTEFREDLKTLYTTTGVENKSTVFLFVDTQVLDEAFLEDLNNLLSSGEVPNLFRNDELEAMKSDLARPAKLAGVNPDDSEAVYNFFIDRVRANLHVVLCMSPVGEAFRNRMRMYPALVNCTTIDWFSEWPTDALLEVADRYLSIVEFPGGDEKRSSVSHVFSFMHKSVGEFSTRMRIEMKRFNYVTPTNYLELVGGYIKLLGIKRSDIGDSLNKLQNGLFKLDDTREKVGVMSIELEDAKKKVAEFQKQCDDYLIIIVQQKRDADEQAKSVAARSEKIGEEETRCKKMAEMALADLAVVMPALEDAVKALESLNKKDLTEIKSYGKPPTLVEKVMEAVMLLRGSEPTWSEAKRQLGDANFINKLMFFDKDNISDKTLQKIGKYCADPDFQPDIIGKVSAAAKSLCMWVRAMEIYGRVFRVVLPKKLRLLATEQELAEKQQILADAKAKLDELQEKIDDLKKQYDEKLQMKEDLRRKAEELVMKLERAEKLVEGLAGEKGRWERTVGILSEKMNYVVGDCLLSAGCLSYLGPFLSNYREELFIVWAKEVKGRGIPIDPDFKIANFIVKPTVIREWNFQGLPNDDFSTENGVIVTMGNRWPLLIDPQGQATKWVRNREAKRKLRIIDLQQSDFINVIEVAVREGAPVLLQNVKEKLDPSLSPILNKAVIPRGDEWIIRIGDREVEYNRDFRFYITTKLGNPHYSPEISGQTCIVNFAVKEQGLEAQLLGIVVRKERPELESMKDTLVTNIAAGKNKLQALENEILRLLNESQGSLLDNELLVLTLDSSKTISREVTEQLETAEETEINIDQAREEYRSCAQRASILFFVLNDMNRIDPMYQFSLDAYVDLFTLSIEKSSKSNNLEERINNINDYHTYAVYRYTCRGLFERHKLLFSFHMSSKILGPAGKLNMEEFSFFLRGGTVLDRSGQVDNPCMPWLIETAWDNVTELEKLSNFHGVVQSFEQYAKDWYQWYVSPEPEGTPLPGDWQNACNELQRMIFVRCLRPDRVMVCATSYVINNMGMRYVEPPILDMNAVLDDSTCKTPLLFVLSPGVDPTGSLVQLAESKHMMNQLNLLSLGQGQSPAAARMIVNGVRDGNWVFLANCHLSLSWMPDLEKMVEQFQTTEPNPTFRLWLSSSPSPEFPISILQAGIKMTTEPPKGLKANMKRLYGQISETQFTACRKVEKYKRMLFALVYFHSVLLERRKFQQLGWNVVYGFNDSDFDVSENLLSLYLDEYEETPWDAMKYLIAGVMYGGHVTDDWDRRLLFTYINQYFCDDVIDKSLFKLSSLPTYYVPRDGSLQHYRDYIKTLPPIDSPEAFGQHPNADVSSQIVETENLFNTLLSLQMQVTVAAGQSREETVYQLSTDVLSKIPQNVDYEGTSKMLAHDPSPFNVVLLQEIQRYNILMTNMRRSLNDLQKGIQGLVVMSSELEDVFQAIYDGKVPGPWLKAYPSMKALGAWTRDMMQRVEQFSTWANLFRPPILFWLAGFTFPSGFLTAVLQTSARLNNIPIDTLTWEFAASAMEEGNFTEQPKDGVFIRGLYLEGAGWDRKNLVLLDAAPMQLVCAMSVILFRPVESKRKSSKGLYACPSYYFPNRSGSTDRASFVISVDLKTGAFPPDHWVKRGTALLLSLAY